MGNVCPHYRLYSGKIYYATHEPPSQKSVEICNLCFAQDNPADIPFKVVTHYRNPNSKVNHDLCRFFESNKLLFSLVDPVNDI